MISIGKYKEFLLYMRQIGDEEEYNYYGYKPGSSPRKFDTHTIKEANYGNLIESIDNFIERMKV